MNMTNNENEIFVSARGLSKSFHDISVCKNLSFDVFRNTMVSLVGPSGSGKSTILNMIGLLESIDSGTLKIDGSSLPALKSRKATLLRRYTINYLFQSFALINNMSVEKNLMIAMKYTNLSKKEKHEKMQEALDVLGIADVMLKPVNTLSGGQMQRVAVARCIVKPGELILADEPTGSLDKTNAMNVFHLLEMMRDEYGKTIILVTHDEDLARACDSSIVLV
ncbi:MAG: ABC transporter ATP-binding protein [Actinomycetaceae bacterium]|nr:ABC transporter ATP-binding protein [Actinomycetaceae bacterium]